MAVIYESNNQIKSIALPPFKEVIDTPEVPGVESVLDDEGNVVTEGVPAVPATYRLETPEEQIERMIAGNMLPNLPWTNWLIVPDDHPAMGGGVITVSDWSNTASVTVTPHPAFPTKAEAQAVMLKWIEELSDEITGKRPLAEKLSWPTKLMVAKEYLANQAGDVPAMISTEAALRGSTPVELAELIVAKGLAFAAAASAIAGLRAKTEAALDAVTDPYEYEVVLAAAAQEAQALKAQLGL